MLPPKLGHIPGTLAFKKIAKKNLQGDVFLIASNIIIGDQELLLATTLIPTIIVSFVVNCQSIGFFNPKYHDIQSLTLPVNIQIYIGGHL